MSLCNRYVGRKTTLKGFVTNQTTDAKRQCTLVPRLLAMFPWNEVRGKATYFHYTLNCPAEADPQLQKQQPWNLPRKFYHL